jgi:hypothetical protein
MSTVPAVPTVPKFLKSYQAAPVGPKFLKSYQAAQTADKYQSILALIASKLQDPEVISRPYAQMYLNNILKTVEGLKEEENFGETTSDEAKRAIDGFTINIINRRYIEGGRSRRSTRRRSTRRRSTRRRSTRRSTRHSTRRSTLARRSRRRRSKARRSTARRSTATLFCKVEVPSLKRV